MKNLFKILTFVLLAMSFVLARNNDIHTNKSVISMKINQFYFEIGDEDSLDKKRSHKRRKVKRKPRRGRDNR